MSSALLNQLNPEQREAVETIEGPLLVLAGAGTGKTRVITYRIGHMISQGIEPSSILGMTFTNKAAREMKERLADLISEKLADEVTVGTFHSFCARLLRKEIKYLKGFNSSFTFAIDSDQKGIIKQAMGELGYSRENLPVEVVLSQIGKAKNDIITPSLFIEYADVDFELKVGKIYERYQQILENQNMLDFDDLLFFVVRIWKENPKVLKRYQDKYKYVLVDEYQDTNNVQFELLDLLIKSSNNLCVVGDDDQSIYGWRGAEVENILNFPNNFKGAKVVKLEQNYRSTNKILKAANQVISVNNGRFDKNLWSDCGDGENIQLITLGSAEEESEFIADAIYSLTSSKEYYNEDIVILYRSNHLSRLLESSLRKAHIPYRIVGSKSFYQRKEILDAVAYIKLIVNPRDDQSLLRIFGVPPRGLGDKAVKILKELKTVANLPLTKLMSDNAFIDKLTPKAVTGAKHFTSCLNSYKKQFSEPGDLALKARDFLTDIGYLNGLIKIYKNREEADFRQDNVNEFINAIAQFESESSSPPSLLDFVESFALLDDSDKVDEEEEQKSAVTLMTVHAAKGLEFPCVFLVGMEYNLFPHERSIKEGNLEEERRLFYVAITRAKERLIMSKAKKRWKFGRNMNQRPSNFLSDLSDELLDKCSPSTFFTPMSNEEILDSFSNIFSILDED